jgi:integrase
VKKQGIRPLELHSTRHTWATMALQAGKSVRWVAEVLGHGDPAFTLRVYAHAMREKESTSPSPISGRPTAPLPVAV